MKLRAIVTYSYRGEVDIPFDQIKPLIESAKLLHVKGLYECETANLPLVLASKEKEKLTIFSKNTNTPL